MQKNILTKNLSYKKILRNTINKSLKNAITGLGYVVQYLEKK